MTAALGIVILHFNNFTLLGICITVAVLVTMYLSTISEVALGSSNCLVADVLIFLL